MKTKHKPKPQMRGNPVFSYTSVCCGAPATKAPCLSYGSVTVRTGLMITTTTRGKEAETQGLGSWRCTTCQNPCSCKRGAFIPAAVPLDKVALPA